MNINIQGVNFINKGAELMLHAILDKFKQEDDSYSFSLALSQKYRGFKECNDLELNGLLTINGFKGYRNLPSYFVPNIVKKRVGLVDEKKVDAVLDASGFLYSDQWGAGPIEKNAYLVKNWKKKGKKVIFLPQAFGPFDNSKGREAMKEIIQYSDLIFARDPKSMSYLIELSKDTKIKMYPDFTVTLKGIIPDYIADYGKYVSIIPNSRMLNKTEYEVSEWYLRLLKNISKFLDKKEMPFIFLIHEDDKDKQIAEEVISDLGITAEIIEEQNPIKIKGIIKNSHAVISSRFHGLVSALSQSIPSLGTGWSHKYKMLFEDYISDKYLLNQTHSDDEVDKLLEEILEGGKRDEIINNLEKSSSDIQAKTNEMWNLVFSTLHQS